MAEHSLSELVPVVQTNPFQFKDHLIRTRLEGESLWFVAKDVCMALAIDWSGKTLSSIPSAWQGMGKFPTPSGNQQVRIINEPAVYKLAFRSNKPAADEFTNWVALEVLPSIRKTGRYSIAPAPLSLTPFPRIKTLPKSYRDQLHDLVLAKLAHVPPAFVWKTRMSIWAAFNAHFSIPRYNLLPEARMAEALTFLSELEVGPAGTVARRTPQLPLPVDDARRTIAALSSLVEQAQSILAALPAAEEAVRDMAGTFQAREVEA